MAETTIYLIVILAPLIICEAAIPSKDSQLFSSQEKVLIKQLRERVKGNLTQPVMSENGYLVRFLRAQKHDLDRTEKMILTMLAWREEEKMDTIFAEDWSCWLEKYPFSLNMHDLEGRRVIASRIGKIDIRRLVLAGKRKMLDRYLTYGFERGLYNVQQGWKGTGFIDGYLLFNMAGYSARTHACLACVPSWINLVWNYERYYPQLASKIIVVNVPRIFQRLFEIMQPNLSAHTAQILQLYDYNNAIWKKELFKLFSEDVLTSEFGGTGPTLLATSFHERDISRIIYYNQTKLDVRKG